MSVAVFLLHIINFLGVGLPAYFNNHSPFSREHNFVGFNNFLLSCVDALSSIFIGHRGLLFFEEWDGILHVCSVMCAQTLDLLV